MTSTSRSTTVSTERTSVIRLKVMVRCSIRSTWKGMKVKPMAKVFSSISRSAGTWVRLAEERVGQPRRGQQQHRDDRAVEREQEEGNRARQPAPRLLVARRRRRTA